MALSFAVVADLTQRGLVIADENQAQTFLDDASDLLRGEVGWQVYPPAAVTITSRPDRSGHVRLPGAPITEVTSVIADEETLTADDYTFHDGKLHVAGCELVTVTYTVGYSDPPRDLVSWTCVLAAQMIARAKMADGGLGATPASISVDDVRINFSTQQQSGAWGIPERALERLRSTFGATAFVT